MCGQPALPTRSAVRPPPVGRQTTNSRLQTAVGPTDRGDSHHSSLCYFHARSSPVPTQFRAGNEAPRLNAIGIVCGTTNDRVSPMDYQITQETLRGDERRSACAKRMPEPLKATDPTDPGDAARARSAAASDCAGFAG